MPPLHPEVGDFGRSVGIRGGSALGRVPAGVKAPCSYGATDDFGYAAVQDPVTVYDFHATILHRLSLDHRRLPTTATVASAGSPTCMGR